MVSTGTIVSPKDGVKPGITFADIVHHLLQFRAVGVLAAHAVNVDLIYPQRFHQHLLPHGILLLGTDPDIADFQNTLLLSLVNVCFPWYTPSLPLGENMRV